MFCTNEIHQIISALMRFHISCLLLIFTTYINKESSEYRIQHYVTIIHLSVQMPGGKNGGNK